MEPSLPRFQAAYLLHFAYLGLRILLWPVFLTGHLGFNQAVTGALMTCMVVSAVAGGWLQARYADSTGRRRVVQRGASAGLVAACAGWLLVEDPAPAFLLAALHGLLAGGHIPLLDATLVDHLGDLRHRYGHVRVFGTLGFVGGAVLLSHLRESDPLLIPAGMALAAAGYHALTWILPDTQASRRRPGSDLRRPLLHLPLVVLLAGVVLHATAFGIFESFQGIHFAQHLGLPPGELSALFAAAYLPEILLFVVVPRLLARFRAHALLLVAVAGSAVRWFALAGVTSFPLLIPLQALHVMTFGLWYAANMQLVGTLVPAERRTSGQALLSMSFAGGMACGAQAGGLLRHHAGPAASFLVAGFLGLGALGLLGAFKRRLREAGAPGPGRGPGPGGLRPSP